MKKFLISAALVLVSCTSGETTTKAQEMSCTRDSVFAGGGAFNFSCKETPGQNYCIPYAFQGINVPRGGADAINKWADVVNNHTSLTFNDVGPVSIVVCTRPGSHSVIGVGSNN